MNGKLRRAAAVVFGGASGLGRAAATRLLERVARVLVVDLPPAAPQGLDPRIDYVSADITDEQAVREALERGASEYPVRAVVITSGVIGSGRILGGAGPMPLAEVRRVIDVNLVGTANALIAGAARMAGNSPEEGDRGVIVMTSSIAAFDGGNIAYASSKAGVAGLALSAAQNLAEHGIRVVAIAPGLMDTPMLSDAIAVRPEVMGAFVHPARKGTPEEYALTVEQIIDNPLLNGDVIRIDGGMRLPRIAPKR